MSEINEDYQQFIKAEYEGDTLNQRQLKELGFMKHHIDSLLPKPEIIPNPYFKGQTMKVWKKSDVLAAMEQEAFQYDGKEKYCESANAAIVRMYQQYSRKMQCHI